MGSKSRSAAGCFAATPLATPAVETPDRPHLTPLHPLGPNECILAPSEHVCIDRRPGQRQCSSWTQDRGIAADDARPQGQSVRLADH